MSKLKIQKALKAKGLELDMTETYFDRSIPVPECYTYGWVLNLTEESNNILYTVSEVDSSDYEHEFSNTSEVLEWIDSLPDCSNFDVNTLEI